MATISRTPSLHRAWRRPLQNRLLPRGASATRQLPNGIGHRLVRCAPERRQDDETSQQRLSGEVVVAGSTLALTFGSLSVWFLFRDAIEDVIYGGGLFSLFEAPVSVGDVSAVALWTVAYYFVSPLQLLYAFLGRFEKERPSDWILRRLGGILNQPTEDGASVGLYGLTWASVFGLAVVTEAGLKLALGDATWGVASGIGACMTAGVFEISRPERLTASEKAVLDQQFAEFSAFADEKLQRTGSCHESEIFRAYRTHKLTTEMPPVYTLRQFMRKWAPQCRSAGNGYFRKISVRTSSEVPL